jgi:hypothetical protein
VGLGQGDLGLGREGEDLPHLREGGLRVGVQGGKEVVDLGSSRFLRDRTLRGFRRPGLMRTTEKSDLVGCCWGKNSLIQEAKEPGGFSHLGLKKQSCRLPFNGLHCIPNYKIICF